jgi:hypothetical protein
MKDDIIVGLIVAAILIIAKKILEKAEVDNG